MNRYINENDKKMDELLQKYIAGNASEKESQRIMEWLREDEQHLREYKRQRKLYGRLKVPLIYNKRRKIR